MATVIDISIITTPTRLTLDDILSHHCRTIDRLHGATPATVDLTLRWEGDARWALAVRIASTFYA